MFLSKSLKVNANGRLAIGGCDIPTLAEKYGTPLYIMDEGLIVENMRAYKDVIAEQYDGNGMIFFASKAFCIKEICRIASREGLGLDVVSGGEMYTALSADVSPANLCFHGNSKEEFEISMAVASGVGRIVVDTFADMANINDMGKFYGKKQKVLVRIKPGVEAHTHDFIKTGQIDSKFGVAIEGGEAMALFKSAAQYENLEVAGVHCHIGSQIFDTDPFDEAARRMIEFMAEVKKETGAPLYELNLGGGFGIRYTEDDNPRPNKEYMIRSIAAVKKYSDQYEIDKPFIMFEPGRSIVGEAGITVYEVGTVKDIPGIRKYVAVNGGMTDNPRYVMYGSRYEALLPVRPLAEKSEMVTICGKCCESGDLLIKDIMMPKIHEKDLLAVLSTGAYNYSMSSNYNRLLKPAVVMVKNGDSRIVVKRETMEDITRNDI